MSEQGILLLSYGHFETEFLKTLEAEISREFFTPVYTEENQTNINEFYDPSRRQYDGNRILKELIDPVYPEFTKRLGLFRVDLFIPILTYIFGQAKLSGDSGIASIFRLRNELYGLTADEDLLLERFGKVVIHELGHMHGLIHCQNPACVMKSSTYVEDIDQKSQNLCGKCRNEIT